MRSKLEQLWEISNQYVEVEADTEEWELLDKMSELEEELRAKGNRAVYDAFNRYTEVCSDYIQKRESIAFSEGVRFATQFLIEAGHKNKKRR